MSLEWADGVLDLFVRCGPWSLFIAFSLDRWLLGEPIMRVDQIAARKSGFSVARDFNVKLNLLRLFVLVSIGKDGRRR